MTESNVYNESKALVEKIKSIVSSMVEDLTKNIEKYREIKREIYSAFLLTVIVATLLNIFSSFLVDWIKTRSSVSLYYSVISFIFAVVLIALWFKYSSLLRPIYELEVSEDIYLSDLPNVRDVIKEIEKNKIQISEKELCKYLSNYFESAKLVPELVEEENLLKWTMPTNPKVTFDISFFSIPIIPIIEVERWYTCDIKLTLRTSVKEPIGPDINIALKWLKGYSDAICLEAISLTRDFLKEKLKNKN